MSTRHMAGVGEYVEQDKSPSKTTMRIIQIANNIFWMHTDRILDYSHWSSPVRSTRQLRSKYLVYIAIEQLL